MALSRRTGARFQASIWPGFVDAMTGLLLVLMFVLTIFMIVQFVLTERISGQETELNELSTEVESLAQVLGLKTQEAETLQKNLSQSEALVLEQKGLIASLNQERAQQQADLESAKSKITSFEAQVATLLAGKAEAEQQIAGLTQARDALEAEKTTLLSEQEALELALAQSRSEVDAQAEAAKLAAARKEALDALVADLRAKNAEAADQLATAQTDLEKANDALSDAEATQLAEAAAAKALRDRLENSDAELTAMTLSLETQRRKAEETLSLLAAARAAEDELNARISALTADGQSQDELRKQLNEALAKVTRREELLADAREVLEKETALSTQAQKQTELLNQQVAELRAQLGDLQGMLDAAVARDTAKEVELQSLGQQLNTALARVASEERRRAELEAAERKRLEEEAKDLERYRSEFFGRLRDVLGAQDGVRIEGDRFVFSSEVLFPPGGASLSAEGRGEVAKVARILRNVSSEIPDGIDWVIRVDGHTDNVPLSGTGEFLDNWELSQARALSVVRYMSQSLGIPPGRLAANGFGEYQPVALGDSEDARARNRRIELKLTEK